MQNLIGALNAGGALNALTHFRQFIVCQFVPDTDRPGKTIKYPIHPVHGYKTDPHDPACWVTATEAITQAEKFGIGYGVGFVFTERDPFFFIDIDECITPAGYAPIVHELVGLLPDAAVEISQSGRGLHIFGIGSVPTDRHIREPEKKRFDLYVNKRFVALTGNNMVGDAGKYDHSAGLTEIVNRYLLRDVNDNDAGWTDAPCPEWNGPSDDVTLINRALRSQSAAAAFGSKASFVDLWTRNAEALRKFFPSDTDIYNASDADSALAQHLAFWTGKDCERIKRLMMQSALYRPKYDRDDYLMRTITGTVRICQSVLTDKHPEPLAMVATETQENPKATVVTGNVFLSGDTQMELFKGCVYVQDMHKIMVPSGTLLKPEQFRVHYGGYTFQMDGDNRRASRDAYEAFTQSQLFRAPRADTATFRPDLKPGMILNQGGMSQVNIYTPIDTPRRPGDATPFLNHLKKLLPVQRDQLILLSYMAAIVQYKGYKFQWCPFIQGVEGNGKTLFSRCVAYAVGEKYTHWPRADQVHKNFNAWQLNMIFIGVEDICISETNQSIWEILKPMITGEKQSIEPKGVDSKTRNVCCNYILNGNSKNGIPKTKNDRRAGILFTAQQSESDLARDSMLGDYLPNLYDWLKNKDGYAIVSELLHTFPIPDEFNPAGACQRAPVTSTTEAAINESQGLIDQEILEAVEQNIQGFCGGWISSMALDKLIDQRHANNKIAINQRRIILQRLGYDWHPALAHGRVNNMVSPDNGKPKLFIHKSSPALAITLPSEVARSYSEAQLHAKVSMTVTY